MLYSMLSCIPKKGDRKFLPPAPRMYRSALYAMRMYLHPVFRRAIPVDRTVYAREGLRGLHPPGAFRHCRYHTTHGAATSGVNGRPIGQTLPVSFLAGDVPVAFLDRSPLPVLPSLCTRNWCETLWTGPVTVAVSTVSVIHRLAVKSRQVPASDSRRRARSRYRMARSRGPRACSAASSRSCVRAPGYSRSCHPTADPSGFHSSERARN